jgi:ADP-heptose:LPS heptosyltransferase
MTEMTRSDGTPRSILVYVGRDLLGDALIKLPFLRALRAAFPQARITWLAGRGKTVFASTLAPVTTGLIDEVIQNGGVTGREWLPTHAAPMPDRDFDLIVDTQRHVRTTLSLRRIRHRVFISGALGWLLSDRRPRGGRAKKLALIHQLLALVEAASGVAPDFQVAPLSIDAAVMEEARRLLPERDDGRAYIGIAPGASLPHKLWPLDRFLTLAERLEAAGFAPVILLGPLEQGWTADIRARLPQVALPLPPDASPLLTIAVCTRLAAAVANDSGQGHLLAAAGVPLVSLFGPTQAAKFPPMTPRLTVIRAQDFGDTAMTAIPVPAVERALLQMLKETAAP